MENNASSELIESFCTASFHKRVDKFLKHDCNLEISGRLAVKMGKCKPCSATI